MAENNFHSQNKNSKCPAFVINYVCMQTDEYPMKVVGRKGQPKVNVETANDFLKMVAVVRGNCPFMPKGVWRFKTFEEADAWKLQMMTRR